VLAVHHVQKQSVHHVQKQSGAKPRPVGTAHTIVMSPVTSNGCDSSCSCSPSVSLISSGGGWRWRRWAISMWLLLQS
jgi:hypothetical protein